ncbi:MAG: ABC transporter permease [Bacillota bacterium]
MTRELKAIYVIWLRDVLRFVREKPRIIGMIGQPLLYLLIMGNGLSAALRLNDAPPGFSYLEFMYPGIIGMSVLFTSVYSAISIVWDREFGFLKEVLVAHVPRWAVAVGKALGGSTISMLQATILLMIAPFLGIKLTAGTVLSLWCVLFIIAFSLTSLGIIIASRMESMEGFQMIMNFLVMPLFFLSGAMFPLRGVQPWMESLMRIDPLTYGVDAIRNIFFAQSPYRDIMVQFSLGTDLLVISGMAVVFILLAAYSFSHAK